ncbi:MAG: relaxase/mobilization nuclease domain-containing protein [Chitinophagaceae bacterium]
MHSSHPDACKTPLLLLIHLLLTIFPLRSLSLIAVYRHYDSGHPHIHIVSTNIQRDGKRISMHNMGRNQSEKARKEIEIEFGLVKAESEKLAEGIQLIPVNAQKVIYGKAATKQAISNVLLQVIDKYKYSSLAELNAILKLYNVVAISGDKGSVKFQQKGLTNYGLSYRVLDENGNAIGAPIKAVPSLLNQPAQISKRNSSLMKN